MKKLIVRNLEGKETHGATSDQFENEEAFNAWIEATKASGAWGKPAHIEQILDEDGMTVIGEVEHPDQFTLEIIDITDEVERERVNAEALAYLASTDWLAVRQAETGVEIPEDVRAARQAARERIVKV